MDIGGQGQGCEAFVGDNQWTLDALSLQMFGDQFAGACAEVDGGRDAESM